MADMAGVMGEITERNAELESENAHLVVVNKHLEEQVEKLRCNLVNTVHQPTEAEKAVSPKVESVEKALRECEQRLATTKKELKHVKKVLFEKNRRYQEDCITINRLQVTIETLVERMAQSIRR